MSAVYLDHAATTPPRPASVAELGRWLAEAPGNASSTHGAGRRARVAVEESRETIARHLGVDPNEVVFTSGGTEADNLAVKGLAWAGRSRGRTHLVTTSVEHPAVLEPARWLAEQEGFDLTVVPCETDARVDPERVLAAVRPDTALVSVMAANNEVGAINDVATIGAALRDREVPFHVDAVQSFATQDVAPDRWPCDALSLSAHKFGGPQGVGVAYLRRGVPVVPLTHGGGQDRGVRSGTFAAALDAACGVAVSAAVADRAALGQRLQTLADRLVGGLTALEGVRRNGPLEPRWRLPSHVHLSVDGVDGEALTFALDAAGLHVATGSACGAGAVRRSHVVEAAAIDGDAVLRLTLGWTTTEADIDAAVSILTEVVPDLRRRLSPPTPSEASR